MYETVYSRSLHGADWKFRLPVWLQPARAATPFRLAASWQSLYTVWCPSFPAVATAG